MDISSDPEGLIDSVSTRRQSDRKLTEVNKVLEVQVRVFGDEKPQASKLAIHDVSDGGMRVESPEQWKEKSRISLTLPLKVFGPELPLELTVECEVRWRKPTTQGQAQYGLRFVELDAPRIDAIGQWLDRLTHVGGRHHHRLDILMPVEMELKDQKMSIAIIRNLSHGGLRFRTKESLKVKAIVKFRLPIPKGRCVTGNVKLAWRCILDDGYYEYGAAFCQISDAEKVLIDELLEHEAPDN